MGGALPLLSGEAQQAVHSLPSSARANFSNVRKAMLDRTGYSPEEQRRRFRKLVMAAGDRLFAYVQRLTDLARRWLLPEIRSAASIVEQVVLEWFLVGLPIAKASTAKVSPSFGARCLSPGPGRVPPGISPHSPPPQSQAQ